MKWNISKNVKHNLAPAEFAYEYAKSFAKKMGLPWKVRVKVTNMTSDGRGYCGRACGDKGNGRILVRLADKLPNHVHRYNAFADMPSRYLSGQSESIVYIFAHEFGHIIGYGSGKAAEIACCKFGYAAVDAWRERQYNDPACLI